MAANNTLHELIEALAGAVIEAQDRIEQHQLSNILNYFDDKKRPRALDIILPSLRPDAKPEDEDYYRVPLLPLVPLNPLRIKDVEVSFDVELGDLKEKEGNKSKKVDGNVELQQNRNDIMIDTSGGRNQKKGGNIHVVLRVEHADPTDGASRMINHLVQTQGVYKTESPD